MQAASVLFLIVQKKISFFLVLFHVSCYTVSTTQIQSLPKQGYESAFRISIPVWVNLRGNKSEIHDAGRVSDWSHAFFMPCKKLFGGRI